jgi:hypothetical protein
MNFSEHRPKVYFKTFGCRTNVFDTQVMMSNLKDFEVTQDEKEADVVVINSCTVTNSADTPDQALEAHNKGLRTFRVIPISQWQAKGKESLLPNEVLCPACKEAGARVTCSHCLLCSGQYTKAKSIAIPAHGIGKIHHKGQ